MNRFLLFIGVCMMSLASFGQEICDNGIDDDADGLIDLNDVTDCACNTLTINSVVPSLIPNPSFEEVSYCPSQLGQLDASKGWIQATNGTTDYMNTCGYVSPCVSDANLLPFPDGNGIAGIIIEQNHNEYLGACLLSPLLKGITYTLKLNIASVTINTGLSGNPSETGGTTASYGDYGPIDFTIYGATDCSHLPVDTDYCPTIADPSWVVMGSVSYNPEASWSTQSITFTPTENINTIMIGSPCAVPSNFPFIEHAENTFVAAYFLIDNLILNKSSLLEPLSITANGSYCTNDLKLTASLSINTPPNSTYQWYKDGKAIIGATAKNYSVPAGVNGVGNYQIRLTNGVVCGLSSKITIVEETLPIASLNPEFSTISIGDSIQFEVSGGTNFIWSPISDLSCSNCPNPKASPKHDTQYCVQVSNGNTCNSTKCSTVKVLFPCGEIFVPNAFSPNGDNNNDKLEVKINPACVSEYSFLIFDRWGEKIFETDKITDSWDGKHNGKEVDNAVFVYQAKVKLINSNEYLVKKGNVSIIK